MLLHHLEVLRGVKTPRQTTDAKLFPRIVLATVPTHRCFPCPLFGSQALKDEDEVRDMLREAHRVAKRHVVVLVMTCGTNAVNAHCEALKHSWVNVVKPASWWSKVGEERV